MFVKITIDTESKTPFWNSLWVPRNWNKSAYIRNSSDWLSSLWRTWTTSSSRQTVN